MNKRPFELMRGALLFAWHIGRNILLLFWILSSNRLRAAEKRKKAHSIIGEILVRLILALGPTYIKLAQMFASRSDLFPAWLTEELKQVPDRLPDVWFPTICAIFREDLKANPEDVFKEFQELPIAKGSIAIVYRAELWNGSAVAVKVRRPGISHLVRRDLAFLYALAAILDRVHILSAVSFSNLAHEFGKCILKQIDFRLEAAANRRLHKSLAFEERIILPRLIDRLCTRRVLTMEFIPQIGNHNETNPIIFREGLVAVLRGLYRMIFVEGLIHCDLHPGNIAFTKDGRAVVIDFGFMAELKHSERLDFARFFLAMAFNNGEMCAEIILKCAAHVSSDLRRNAFVADIADLIDRESVKSTRDFNLAAFIKQLFAVQKRHRIVSTTAFTMALIALLEWEGLARDCDAQIDFKREAHPYLFRASILPVHTENSSGARFC